MGMQVAAVDIADEKLALAEDLGTTLTVNARTEEPGEVVQEAIGGVHGALVTAVSTAAFRQALDTLRRGGTLVLNGLPPGDIPLPIFNTVLNGITVRGSIVGTRDVYLGDLHDCPFYMARDQFAYWEHMQLTIDVKERRGASFSLEIPMGVRFVVRSRLFSDEQYESLPPVEHVDA